MIKSQHILVVDDERRVRELLQRYLQQEGFRVTLAEGGGPMRDLLATDEVDLVLLDLVLPEENGLQLAREIRAASSIPIIMLTGRADMVDRVVGLELGADDYIAKPFHLREVLARIRSVLRRSEAANQPGPERMEPADPGVYHFSGWRFDPAARILEDPNGNPVELTRGEFDLLYLFVQRPQRTLTREILMDLTKGRGYETYDRAIDAQVARLRRKIETDTTRPNLIKSVRGVGYTFAAAVTRT